MDKILRKWTVRHWIKLAKDPLGHPMIRFCDLANSRVICGERRFAADVSQELQVYGVSTEHQIQAMRSNRNPGRYCGFDAHDISGRTLVALAYHSELAVCVYELQANDLVVCCRIGLSKLRISSPAQVLWYGERLLVASVQNSDQLVAFKLTSSDGLVFNSEFHTNKIANWIRMHRYSWELRVIGDRLIAYGANSIGLSGTKMRIFSLKFH